MAQVYKVDNKRYTFEEIDSLTQTTYTLTEADHNKWIKIKTDDSSVNLNLPDNLSEGFKVTVENTGVFTINYINLGSTSISTQQDPFTEDQYRTVELVYNSSEWRIQGFIGRNEISGLFDVNVNLGGPPSDGQALVYDANTGMFTSGDLPPLIPRDPILLDYVLDNSDHAKVIPVNTSASSVTITINPGLDEGFYVRIINVAGGTVNFTTSVNFNTPISSLIGEFAFIDIFHSGGDTYYAITNDSSGNEFINVVGILPANTGSPAQANSNNSISIGNGSTTGSGSVDAIALGTSSVVGSSSTAAISIGASANASSTGSVALARNATATAISSLALGDNARALATGAIQLGDGANSTPNSLQFRDNKIATVDGIWVPSINGIPNAASEDGSIIINSFDKDLYFRDGGAWHSKTRRLACEGQIGTFSPTGQFAGNGDVIEYTIEQETEAGSFFTGNPGEINLPVDGVYSIQFVVVWENVGTASGYRNVYLQEGLSTVTRFYTDVTYGDPDLATNIMVNSGNWTGYKDAGTNVYLVAQMFQAGALDAKQITQAIISIEYLK